MTKMPHGSSRLIFIGGVHGSGKTTIGKKVATRVGAKLHSCSQIIRSERQAQVVSPKGVADVDVNQQALIAGLNKLRTSMYAIILDGHFTLRTQDDGIQPIPIPVFDAMLPDALFLVEASSSTICSRLASRDGLVMPETSIVEHQEHERRFAGAVSLHLGLQLFILNGDDESAHFQIDASLSRP